MHGPPLVGWLLVALAAGTGLLCLLRARAAGSADGAGAGGAGAGGAPCARRTARAEAVHGLGMALMAVPVAMPGQGAWKTPLLIAVYGALILRALPFGRGERHRVHRVHRVHHAVEAASMVYMAAAMSAAPAGMDMGSMAGMDHGTMGVPAVNALLLGYFALYALCAGTRITAVPPVAAEGAGAVRVAGAGFPAVMRAPETGAACRVSLAVGMFVMTLMM